MDTPATVVGLVTGLVDTYASLLHHYTTWKHAKSQRNTYRKQPGRQASQGVGATCALSTSLGISGPMIKETYDNGVAIVGNEFSTGDSGTREKLWAQLQGLSDRLDELRQAGSGPVELAQLLQTSESARTLSLKALATQYQRFAIGRPIPAELPMPKPRSRQDDPLRSDSRQGFLSRPPLPPDFDDDRMTTAMTISSGPLNFQSDPPSPPPTPKLVPDDTESTWVGSDAGVGGGGAGTGAGMGMGMGMGMLRPKNSVFSVFCPEAMTFQVDLHKSTPRERKRCKCGYRWKPALPDTKDCILLKEGFRMTARFLAKSHCDKKAYGCVLCTSSGKTEKYESAEHLRVHINASHTKWQMLHDRDMT